MFAFVLACTDYIEMIVQMVFAVGAAAAKAAM